MQINKIMNSSSINSINSGSASENNCFSSKLRRFKIQEGVLTTNVNKCILLNPEENDGHTKYNDDTIQLKKYLSKLKDNFQEIKHLFEEITLKTNDQDSFERTDIDELKKDILELETKMRTAKQFIRNELQALRNEETLMEKPETLDTSSEEKKCLRRNARIPQIKGYKEIVHSPVRVMINSPFKSLEVQQFHEFMKNSSHRYGGWNEYNHNVFIQIWNKYYAANNMIIAEKSIEDTLSYKDFKEEVLHKISGSSLDSIDSHSKWYLKYLHLKINKQKALNKWQENKRKIKPSRKARLIQIDDSMVHNVKSPVNIKLCRKQNNCNVMDRNINTRRNRATSDTSTESMVEHSIIYRNGILNSSNDWMKKRTISSSEEVQGLSKKIDLIRLLKPTKQWLIKQESERETYEFNENVESIAKLRTPTWRLSMRE